MAGTLTVANATIALTVDSLYPVPVPIQGFAADDVFGTEGLSNAETMMGVDGRFSAGFVYNPITLNITLMADSPSNALFEVWTQYEQVELDKLEASMIVRLKSIGRSYALTRGFITNYPPTPDGRRVLQPRRYTLQFGKLGLAPI